MANGWKNLKAELKAAQDALAAERAKPMLREFGDRLGHGMAVILAATPYEEWPRLAKAVFEHERNKTPTTGYLYKEGLPK